MNLIRKGVPVARWVMLGSLPVIICFFLAPLLRLTSTSGEGSVDVRLSADAGMMLRNSAWGLGIYDVKEGKEKLFMDLRAVRVAFSPDARRFAHTALEGGVHLRGVPDGRLQRVLTYEGRGKVYGVCVSSLAFSSDGELLAGTKDGRAYLWEVQTGRLSRTLACEGKEPWIRGLAFSPDGKTVAAAYLVVGPTEKYERKARLVLWESDTGRLVSEGVLMGDSCEQVVFSADGEFLAIGGTSEKGELLRAATCERIRGFEGSHPVSFSPDGSLLAFTYYDGVHVLRVRDGGEETTMQGGPPTDRWPDHPEDWDLSFSPDGKSLIAATTDGGAYTWDVPTRSLSGSVLGLRPAVVRIPKLWAVVLIMWIGLWELAGRLAPQRRTETASGQRVLQSQLPIGHHLVTFAAAMVLACGVVIPLLFPDRGAPSPKCGRMLLPLAVCLIGLGCVLAKTVARRPPRVNGLATYSLALTIAFVVFQFLLTIAMWVFTGIARAG